MTETPRAPAEGRPTGQVPDVSKASTETSAGEQGTPATPPSAEKTAPAETRERKSFTVNLPLVTMEFRAPHMPKAQMPHPHMPHMTKEQMPKPHMPRADHVAYYGGLGALAAFEVIEWPVAAAIGIGTAVAERVRRTAGPQTPPGTDRPETAPPAPSRPAAASG